MGRREEQWRQVWGELEALVRAHAAAPQHRALLRVLLDCRAHNNHQTDSMYLSMTVHDIFLSQCNKNRYETSSPRMGLLSSHAHGARGSKLIRNLMQHFFFVYKLM